MPDPADIASDTSEQMLELSIKKAREAKAHLTITGRCYNCGAPTGALFCDNDCRDDHTKRERAIRSF